MAERAPITVAIDDVVRDVIAPPLKDLGFRKDRGNWLHGADGAVRGVTVQRPRIGNAGVQGRFTIGLGVSYPSLGEDTPSRGGADGCRHYVRLGTLLPAHPPDLWWEYRDAADPADRQAVSASVAQAFRDYGLPYLVGSADPAWLVRYRLDNNATGLETVELAAATGDAAARGNAVDLYLSYLRGAPPTWGAYPLAGIARSYSRITVHLRALKRDFEPEDRARASAALDDLSGAISQEVATHEAWGMSYDPSQLAVGGILLARHLGADPAPFIDRADSGDLSLEMAYQATWA